MAGAEANVERVQWRLGKPKPMTLGQQEHLVDLVEADVVANSAIARFAREREDDRLRETRELNARLQPLKISRPEARRTIGQRDQPPIDHGQISARPNARRRIGRARDIADDRPWAKRSAIEHRPRSSRRRNHHLAAIEPAQVGRDLDARRIAVERLGQRLQRRGAALRVSHEQQLPWTRAPHQPGNERAHGTPGSDDGDLGIAQGKVSPLGDTSRGRKRHPRGEGVARRDRRPAADHRLSAAAVRRGEASEPDNPRASSFLAMLDEEIAASRKGG